LASLIVPVNLQLWLKALYRHYVAEIPLQAEKRACRFHYPLSSDPRPASPQGEGWAHELKHDGYRLQIHIRDGRVRIRGTGCRDRAGEALSWARASSSRA